MGVWMIGTGNISIKPQVDAALIKEYVQFSKSYYPEEYGEECFSNTWFFDDNDKLLSIAGKFAEPSIWYRHIKEFFKSRGYELVLSGKLNDAPSVRLFCADFQPTVGISVTLKEPISANCFPE